MPPGGLNFTTLQNTVVSAWFLAAQRAVSRAGIVLCRSEPPFLHGWTDSSRGMFLPRNEWTIPQELLDAVVYRNLSGRWAGSQKIHTQGPGLWGFGALPMRIQKRQNRATIIIDPHQFYIHWARGCGNNMSVVSFCSLLN